MSLPDLEGTSRLPDLFAVNQVSDGVWAVYALDIETAICPACALCGRVATFLPCGWGRDMTGAVGRGGSLGR